MGLKGEKSRINVVNSATYCFLKFGDRKTTFDLIAEHAKVSKALVVRHFGNRENIFPLVLNHWIEWARGRTVSALQEGSAEDRLRNYLRVSIELFASSEFAQIYLFLHYFAGVNERYRVINSEIKAVAVNRIAQIIEEGIAAGHFRKVDAQLTAKSIHNNLVGHVLCSITEIQEGYFLKLPAVLEEHTLSSLLEARS